MSDIEKPDLPTIIQPSGGVMADVSASREVAEVQAAMVIAKRFPRDQAKALDRIIIACQRPTLAEGALYTYARGGSNITGPSIRLAEALAMNWGNMSFGIRELEQKSGQSTVEAFAIDLETNTRQTKVFQVFHVRHTKKGAYNLYDPRDIYELVANQGARRLRTCVLGVIPGDVVEAAVTQCETTLTAKADISPEAIQKMVGVFKEAGVTREMIEKRIQRKLDSITPAQVISLRKIYNSLKDGMSAPADWFDFEAEEVNGVSQTEKIKEKLKRGWKATSPEPDHEKINPDPIPPTGEGADNSTGEASESQGPSLVDLVEQLAAKDWPVKRLEVKFGKSMADWGEKELSTLADMAQED